MLSEEKQAQLLEEATREIASETLKEDIAEFEHRIGIKMHAEVDEQKGEPRFRERKLAEINELRRIGVLPKSLPVPGEATQFLDFDGPGTSKGKTRPAAVPRLNLGGLDGRAAQEQPLRSYRDVHIVTLRSVREGGPASATSSSGSMSATGRVRRARAVVPPDGPANLPASQFMLDSVLHAPRPASTSRAAHPQNFVGRLPAKPSFPSIYGDSHELDLALQYKADRERDEARKVRELQRTQRDKMASTRTMQQRNFEAALQRNEPFAVAKESARWMPEPPPERRSLSKEEREAEALNLEGLANMDRMTQRLKEEQLEAKFSAAREAEDARRGRRFDEFLQSGKVPSR